MNDREEALATHTADIVAAHVANNSVSISDVGRLISIVHEALAKLDDGSNGAGISVPEAAQKPAVTVRASIKPDRLICLEDGMSMKMLRRHLNTHHQMTPAQYRAKWNLPNDYPMVAAEYRELRSTLAKQIGLGRKPGPRPARKTRPKV